MPKGELFQQLELVKRLVRQTDVLATCIPENTLVHVIDPNFGEPSVIVRDYDVSNQLRYMADQSRHLLVSRNVIPGEWIDGVREPPFTSWEVYPPRGYSFIGSYPSSCFGNANLEGIGSTFYCPRLKRIGPKRIGKLVESGVVDVDMLSWFERHEGWYDPTKPPSILMNLLEKDSIAGLEVASWILSAIQSSRDIHPEEQKLKL